MSYRLEDLCCATCILYLASQVSRLDWVLTQRARVSGPVEYSDWLGLAVDAWGGSQALREARGLKRRPWAELK
jgi:hypothetical protein